MIYKLLISILAGCAVALTLTFCLLKKVRVKQIRYTQGTVVLGLPISLLAFLLQTSLAVPVVVVTAILSLLVIALELTLRHLVSSASDRSAISQMGKIGSQVDFNEARAAAGAYPDEYMTEDVWLEMQEFMESRRTQKRVLDSDQNKNPVLKYNETRQNINFVGMNYSMHEGIRNTTDSPAGVVGIPHIQIFGGSTVVCEEMPDRLVVTSFLQRMLHGLNAAIRVLNNGASGATTIDRVQMLTQETKLENLDIVIFYFGDNDSGWIDSRSGKSSQQLVWLPVRLLRELSNWGFETARWAYGEFSPRSFRKFSQSAVADTITALNEAHEYCFSKGAHMIAVLQPNLYTLQTKSEYEKKLEKRFSQDIKILVIDAYKQYEAWVKQIPFGVSATHIFDNAPAPVFLDRAHVNARGNELIAKFIFEELKKRKLISVDEEV